MTKGYISVKCPRCTSTVELAKKGVRANILLCPICLEGEIEYQVELLNIDTIMSESPRGASRPHRHTPVLVKA